MGLKIAVDFDGTCVEHSYPDIGYDIGAIPVLKRLVKAGHHIILNTMRSGRALEDAVDWFIKNKITLYGIYQDPDQYAWTQSPKCYAHIYIDDAALGCPLTKNYDLPEPRRSFVDWDAVEKLLFDGGLLEKEPEEIITEE